MNVSGQGIHNRELSHQAEHRRLTRRCSGLASLAAELHIVIGRSTASAGCWADGSPRESLLPTLLLSFRANSTGGAPYHLARTARRELSSHHGIRAYPFLRQAFARRAYPRLFGALAKSYSPAKLCIARPRSLTAAGAPLCKRDSAPHRSLPAAQAEDLTVCRAPRTSPLPGTTG
jgi:hypothetical protein